MAGNPYYQSRDWRALRAARLRIDRDMCVVEGCGKPAVVVDHIHARPSGCPVPCRWDTLGNLRSLCFSHDSQVKELRRDDAERRGDGFRVKGCDEEGWPFDPKRRARA